MPLLFRGLCAAALLSSFTAAAQSLPLLPAPKPSGLDSAIWVLTREEGARTAVQVTFEPLSRTLRQHRREAEQANLPPATLAMLLRNDSTLFPGGHLEVRVTAANQAAVRGEHFTVTVYQSGGEPLTQVKAAGELPVAHTRQGKRVFVTTIMVPLPAAPAGDCRLVVLDALNRQEHQLLLRTGR